MCRWLWMLRWAWSSISRKGHVTPLFISSLAPCVCPQHIYVCGAHLKHSKQNYTHLPELFQPALHPTHCVLQMNSYCPHCLAWRLHSNFFLLWIRTSYPTVFSLKKMNVILSFTMLFVFFMCLLIQISSDTHSDPTIFCVAIFFQCLSVFNVPWCYRPPHTGTTSDNSIFLKNKCKISRNSKWREAIQLLNMCFLVLNNHSPAVK